MKRIEQNRKTLESGPLSSLPSMVPPESLSNRSKASFSSVSSSSPTPGNSSYQSKDQQNPQKSDMTVATRYTPLNDPSQTKDGLSFLWIGIEGVDQYTTGSCCLPRLLLAKRDILHQHKTVRTKRMFVKRSKKLLRKKSSPVYINPVMINAK